MVIIIMGVAGSGKSTIGHLLADKIGCAFLDADDFHPQENIMKMSKGIPLTDKDRAPWLQALRAHVAGAVESKTDLVLACSALRNSYRETLTIDPDKVKFVFLDGDPAILAERLARRPNHFMKPAMLGSQLSVLEKPLDALKLDISQSPASMVAAIRSHLAI